MIDLFATWLCIDDAHIGDTSIPIGHIDKAVIKNMRVATTRVLPPKEKTYQAPKATNHKSVIIKKRGGEPSLTSA